MPLLGLVWTGIKWLGGAAVSGIIGEWISEKVEASTQPQISIDEAATQIIVIGGLVAMVSYIFTITLISMKKGRR